MSTMENAELAKELRGMAAFFGFFIGDVLTQAADRIEHLAQYVDWRPIETAPKDGTVILVHCPRIAPGCYETDSCANEQQDWLNHAPHWLPIPPAPGQKGEKE